jgi:GNAT superfamily N-acetyltransferase
MAHVLDVFVVQHHRGHGLGVALIDTLLKHPALVSVRRWTLSTADAHALYAKFGFEAFREPEKQMIRMAPISIT